MFSYPLDHPEIQLLGTPRGNHGVRAKINVHTVETHALAKPAVCDHCPFPLVVAQVQTHPGGTYFESHFLL